MKARVKNVPVNTIVRTDDWHDSFAMTEMIGEEIEVSPKCKDWFIGTAIEGAVYNYHVSWLDFKDVNYLLSETEIKEAVREIALWAVKNSFVLECLMNDLSLPGKYVEEVKTWLENINYQ
jgi:hypothetical protein